MQSERRGNVVHHRVELLLLVSMLFLLVIPKSFWYGGYHKSGKNSNGSTLNEFRENEVTLATPLRNLTTFRDVPFRIACRSIFWTTYVMCDTFSYYEKNKWGTSSLWRFSLTCTPVCLWLRCRLNEYIEWSLSTGLQLFALWLVSPKRANTLRR